MTQPPAERPLDAQVLVVGAGPTGLMLANWLLRLGVSVEVLDSKSGPTQESRALAVQARTMEIYDQLGVVADVLARCRQTLTLAPGFERRVFGRIPLGALGGSSTPYPRIYVMEQSKNEELLYENLVRLGGSVRWGHRVTAVALDASDAVVTAEGDGRSVTLRGRFCVGADGSASTVRKLRGIAFDGVTNAHTFFVADATHVRGLVSDAVNVRLGRDSFLLTFPMGSEEHHRLLGTVRDESTGPPGVAGPSHEPELSEQTARERLSRVNGVTYDTSLWFSTYRVQHRIAAHFRDGPFFLAGDAGHVHSPVGAQGMNTGLQDAHNLAFKIADVIRGLAPDSSLDRYEAERRPVAQRLVRSTDRLFGLVISTTPAARALRRVIFPVLGPVAVRVVPKFTGASRIFEYVSQTRVHYWMSDAARTTGRRGQVVGRRLRWTGDNFESLKTLEWQVHCYGNVDAGTLDRLRPQLNVEVQVFPAGPKTPLREGMVYLVRPDGFVAAEATPAEAPTVLRAALPDGLR